MALDRGGACPLPYDTEVEETSYRRTAYFNLQKRLSLLPEHHRFIFAHCPSNVVSTWDTQKRR